MPASLRWLWVLLGLGVLGAAAAITVHQWQRHQERQILGRQSTGGDPEAGRAAMLRHGCGGCHRISGVPAAAGRVGPSLNGLARRPYVAGRLVNEPKELMRWIRHPREIDPHSAMPDLEVTAEEARDIAAYLYGLGSILD